MKITKYGHSCLLVEEGSGRVLIDPGSYSTIPELSKLDAIVITHAHDDHADINAIKALLKTNPIVPIFTNHEVEEKLAKENITCTILEDGQQAVAGNIVIEGYGVDHAIIHPSFPRAKNTGYMISGRLFHPGDALFVPPVPVEILAVPVVAPWSKVSETIDYVAAVNPKTAFSIHDGFLKPGIGMFSRLGGMIAEKQGTKWMPIEDGKPIEL